jgi:hypothetical protein
MNLGVRLVSLMLLSLLPALAGIFASGVHRIKAPDRTQSASQPLRMRIGDGLVSVLFTISVRSLKGLQSAVAMATALALGWDSRGRG